MDPPCSLPRGIKHRYWCWSCHCDSEPDQHRQSKAGQRGKFKPEGMSRTQMMNHSEGQQEYSGRNRRQSNQAYVYHSVDFLAAAAVFTGGKVFFVVAAHFWRQAGYVIPPACKDFAYDWIHTLLTHLGVLNQQIVSPTYRRIGSNASVWDAKSTRLQNRPPLVASAFSASLRAISG
jgi:hypothetical protein